MSKPIKIKINVKKLLKEHFFHAKSGAVYVDLVAWPNKSGPGEYGDTHTISQDLPKEARDAGVKSEICGNLKMPDDSGGNPARNFSRPPARSDSERFRNPQPTGRGEDDGKDLDW